MEQNLNEFFYINDIEFFTLLASFGVEKWYGINSELDFEKMIKDSSNQVIASLYQKGYASIENYSVKLSKELSDIFSVLINAKTYLYIRRYANDTPVILFYVSGDRAVYVERSINDDDMLKLSYYTTKGLEQFFKEECYYEDISSIDADELYPKDSIVFNDEVTEQLIDENELVTVIEKYNVANGKMTDRFMVQDLGVNYRLYLQSSSSEICMENTDEKQEFVSNLLIGD